jgi:peptide/nickel transport system substrate-binding protein
MSLLRSLSIAPIAASVIFGWSVSAGALDYVETPSLAEDVKAGKLPPVAERVPEKPLILNLEDPGKHGGTMRMLIGRAKDVRMMVVYGYARLAAYDTDYALKPDILEGFTVEEGRIFTFKLRKGHKWSDGHPFTTEDFRYYWEDVANDPDLSPAGPPVVMLVDGEAPKIEFVDETTVRFSWSKPNPFFLPRLAGAAPFFLYRPAHYLKQFHFKYAGEKANEMAKEAGRRNWASLHNKKDNLYRFDNPDLPTLQPWRNTVRPPATRFLSRRNPFFHRVDGQGRQLPYIDEVIMNVTDGKLIAAKSAAGEADVQSRGLNFNDFTVLKESEDRSNYNVRLWKSGAGAHLVLYPNLNVLDDQWRAVMRDARFRRALSLGVDRALINNTLYFGLALEANNTALPESPLFREEYQTAWTELDLDKANALLDEMGLKRNDDGVRLLPDGRTMEIIVETAGESTEQTDVLELIRDNWAELGIPIFVKPSQREVFRTRIFSGETLMSIWSGYANGLYAPASNPEELAPTAQIHLQWPKWGQYYETGGKSGEAPDIPEAKELLSLYKAWTVALDDGEREKIWHRMLAIHADQIYTIGIVSGVPQPVVARRTIHNVPEEGVYAWDPGAHLGIYRPDSFWFDK